MINLLLVVLAFFSYAQTVPPKVKIAWYAYPDAARYDVWKAPLLTDADGNDSCGVFTKLGNTGGLWMVDAKVVSGGRYCYSVAAAVNLEGDGVLVMAIIYLTNQREYGIIWVRETAHETQDPTASDSVLQR